MERNLKLALAILLLGCLADMPYGYYQFIRFVGLLGFGWLAFSAKEQKNDLFFYVWAASALLINPFFKIALGRNLWNIIDVAWAALLLATVFMDPRPTQKNN